MPVKVNGYLIEPAPLIQIEKQVEIAGNQTKLGQTYRLAIEGDLVGWMGSPQGGSLNGSSWGGWNGLFWSGVAPAPNETVLQEHKLYNLEQKAQALEYIFSVNGSTIEWESPDGSAPLKANFKNANVVLQQGNWAQTLHYNITAECDLLYLNNNIVQDAPFSGLIQQASENWNIQIGEVVKTFNVQHDISAQGKSSFDTNGNISQPAWINARDFILNKLVLGWNGLSDYSNTSGDYIFKRSALASGVLNFNQYTPYNYSLVETVDEINGSVSITENWTLSTTPSGSHTYTVNTRRIVDDPYTTVVTNIQGSVHGYYDGLFNYEQRFDAANYAWSQLGAPTGLLNFITNTYSGYQYNTQPRQGSMDYDYTAGVINYNYEFSNQLYDGDAFEQWSISRKTSADNYITTYGIQGTIKGRRYDGDTDVRASFNRAYTLYSSLSGNNYDTIYQRVLSNNYFPEASGLGVQPGPISKDINLNEAEGIITYSLEFNNRFLDDSDYTNLAQETFQISQRLDTDQGVTSWVINGDIAGLNVTDTSNPRDSKYNNALVYFSGYVLPNMYSRVSQYYDVSLSNPNPQVKEVTYFPVEGKVSYSYEYRNTPAPILPGVLSEHITISEENARQTVNVIAQQAIPGRLDGPVKQDVRTTTSKYRTISLEAIVTPTGGSDFLACYNAKPDYSSYIDNVKPVGAYTESDTETWDWKQGHFGRTVRWLY